MSTQVLNEEAPETSVRPMRMPETISGETISRLQRRHFLVYNVAPFIGLIVAIVLLWWLPFGWLQIGLLLGMWALSMIGMSVGLHRYFAHNDFKTSNGLRNILAILGCMGAQGPVISWVAVHRRHHAYSDKDGDPHSPSAALHGGMLRGFWHAHVGWLTDHEYPNPLFYAHDLARDKALNKINRYYGVWVILGLVIPTVLGGLLAGSWTGALLGFLWGGPVRMFLVDNSILSINSISHMYGGQPFRTGDNSRNNAWVALPTFGESWQNNHHAFANSAKLGIEWWQVDLGYWVIWFLEKVGLVWDVKVASDRQLQKKRIV